LKVWKEMIKKIVTGLLFASVVFPVYAVPVIRMEPANVGQGKYSVININTEGSLENPYIQFNGKKLRLAKVSDNNYRAIIGIAADQKPGRYPLEVVDNKENILESSLSVAKGKFGSQSISYYKPKLTKAQQETIRQEDALVEKAKYTFSEKQLWDGSFILPVNNRVISFYGMYRYLNGKYNGYHGGVDQASPMGTPLKAVNNGKVTLARYFSRWNDNGNIIFLDHGQGVTSAYLHLSRIAVKEGDYVEKGQVIAYTGNTGRSTGPHLHWGVYLNGQNTDGLYWVKNFK
jgi:murein DD-endopeptidase MepM/ murein hydrolase activator NlpD